MEKKAPKQLKWVIFFVLSEDSGPEKYKTGFYLVLNLPESL